MNMNSIQGLQNIVAQMQQQRKPLIEFKAGICNFSMAETTVTPDKRKGKVVITHNQDGNVVIQWKLRPSNAIDWHRLLLPASATWEKVPECTTGRCFLLRFKQGQAHNKLQFFWMQEAKDDKDEELFKKINEIIENPPAPPPNPLAALQQGGAGGAGGGGFNQQQAQLMSMLAQQGGGGAGGQFGHQHQHQHQHQHAAGFPSGNTTGSSANPAGMANVNNDRNMANALANSLSSFLATQMRAGSSINLLDILDADRVMNVLDEDDVKRLLEFLPESQRNPYNMRATMRSPQMQQTVTRLSSILNGSQFNAMMASMNLPHAGTLGVGAFLDSIQAEADKLGKKEDGKEKDKEEGKKEDENDKNNEGAQQKKDQ